MYKDGPLECSADLVLSNPLLRRRRLVASVVDRVGHGALNGFGKDLLDLLWDNGVFTVVQGVRLAGRLACVAAGWVDLALRLAGVSSSHNCGYPAGRLLCERSGIHYLEVPPQGLWAQRSAHSLGLRSLLDHPGRGSYPDRIRS
jgi:hypothetical protein